MNEKEEYEIGKRFVEAMRSAPTETVNGFADAIAEMADRPTVEDLKAAVKKAEERGAARERDKFLGILSDMVPNLQWLWSESQRHYILSRAVKPQVGVMMERLNYIRHPVDPKGSEYDPSTMEMVKKVPSSSEVANKVCEAFSDAYVTIFDDIVVEKIPVSVFVVEVGQ